MSRHTNGILAVWNDIAADNQNDFNNWYLREHIPERVGIPGFFVARRYEAVAGGPRNFTYYETSGPEALAAPAYLERLNHPTAWTTINMARFIGMNRTVARVRYRAGAGTAGMAATLEFSPADPPAGALSDWLAGDVLPRALELPGITRVEHWQGDSAISRVQSTERTLRQGEDEMADHVLMAHGTDAGALAGLQSLISPGRLRASGARAKAWVVYRFLYALSDD
ncbi:MAG: hypothetical protein ACR2RL_10230 [Gammaproteobacteria bacterium]